MAYLGMISRVRLLQVVYAKTYVGVLVKNRSILAAKTLECTLCYCSRFERL